MGELRKLALACTAMIAAMDLGPYITRPGYYAAPPKFKAPKPDKRAKIKAARKQRNRK